MSLLYQTEVLADSPALYLRLDLQEDLKLVSITPTVTTNAITITDSNYDAHYALDDARRDIAIVSRSRTMLFRRINSVSQSAPNELLTINASLSTPQAAEARKVCFLRMCRLDADEIELAWLTNSVVRVSMMFREIDGEIE